MLLLAYLAIYTIVFKFADKFILLFLGAREIIDADNKTLFQVFKSQCFKSYVNMPKIYLYSGLRMKAFTLDLGKDWAVVIDRHLLERCDETQLESLVDFLLQIKVSDLAKVQTKAMGIVAVILKLNYWILENILFLTPGEKVYRVISFIFLMFLKPLLEFLYWFSKINTTFVCDDALKSTYFESEQLKKVDSFSEFIAMHLVEGMNYNQLVVECLESFPVFENCKFGVEV